MFVRRDSSIPFANRIPTLRFNNNLTSAPAYNPDDQTSNGPGTSEDKPLPPPPLKSSLKPSSFLHPILVASLNKAKHTPRKGAGSQASYRDPSLTPRNSGLCLTIHVKLIGSINAVEEVARMSIDVLTFPVSFSEATKVDVFGRLKAGYILIVRGIAKMRQVKTPEGQYVLTKSREVKEMIGMLRKTRKNINDLYNKCKTFSRYCDADYNTWTGIVEGTIEARLHAIKIADYRLYSDLKLPLNPVEDYKTYEDYVDYKGPSVNVRCTPESYKFEQPDMDFDQLLPKCQLELTQHITHFCHVLADQSQVIMETCLDKWETDFANVPLRTGYEQIREEVEEVKLDTRKDAALHYELQVGLEALNDRKMDIVKASGELVKQIKLLLKNTKRLIRFLSQTFNGRVEPDNKCFCHGCEKYVDADELVKSLTFETTPDVLLCLPLTPELNEMIDECKPESGSDEPKEDPDAVPTSSTDQDVPPGDTSKTPNVTKA